jgi:hypothetical protein
MTNANRIYQPATTDTTIDGMRRARNSMRIRLWDDAYFAHRYLCHPGHSCQDGCEMSPMPSRAALYNSEIEQA